MQKIFYVSRNEDKAHDGKAPDMDRFQRVEKLNSLIAAGWAIKEMKTENHRPMFVRVKPSYKLNGRNPPGSGQ